MCCMRASEASVLKRPISALRSKACTASSLSGSVMSASGPPLSTPAKGVGHDLVVGGDQAPGLQVAQREVEAGLARGARQGELRRLGRLIGLHQIQRLGLGVGQQAVAVEGDAVTRAQEAHFLGLGGRLRHLGHADGLEGLATGGMGPRGRLGSAA